MTETRSPSTNRPSFAAWLWDRILDRALNAGITALALGAVSALAVFGKVADAFGTTLAVFLALYLFLFVVTTVLVVINQIGNVRDRETRRRGLTLTPVEIERQIRDWLYEFQFRVQDDTKPEAKDERHFQMLAIDDQGRAITVLQTTDEAFVRIATRITFDAQEMASLRADARRRFFDELSLRVIQLGAEYGAEEGPATEVYLERKLFVSAETSALAFFEELMLVRRAYTVTGILFRRAVQAARSAP